MNTVTLEMFCTQSGANAPAPGQANRNVMLQSVNGENVSKFAGSNGGAYVSISNPADSVAASFSAGKRYRVTVEEVIDPS